MTPYDEKRFQGYLVRGDCTQWEPASLLEARRVCKQLLHDEKWRSEAWRMFNAVVTEMRRRGL